MPQAATSGATVSVACKLPNGLHLEVPTEGAARQAPDPRDPNPKVFAVPRTRFTVNGWHSVKKGGRVAGGYGITEGVPAEFWERWKSLHADTALVTRGLVFALPNAASAADKAREQAAVTSGLEPRDQANPGAGLEPLKQS